MPYCVCPNCQQVYHLQVKDLSAWIDRHGDAPAELLCMGCWKELRVGDHIYRITEKPPRFHESLQGKVIELLAEDQAQITYQVQFADGSLAILPRVDLYYLLKS